MAKGLKVWCRMSLNSSSGSVTLLASTPACMKGQCKTGALELRWREGGSKESSDFTVRQPSRASEYHPHLPQLVIE